MMKPFAQFYRCSRHSACMAVLVLAGCFPMLHTIRGVPDAALKYGSGETPVNLPAYRADPGVYPQFRVASVRRTPNRAMLDNGELRTSSEPAGVVMPGDTWEVRYKFNDFLMVNSLEFDRRFCQRVKRPSNLPIMADGRCGYDWCLYVSIRGEVTGGWDTCPTKGTGRFVFMPDPDVVRLQDWGPQPFFKVIERSHAK